MRFRPLGPSAPDVSTVGYGGMHISIAGRPDEAESVRVIHAALDAGVTLIDTADVYSLGDHDIGHNERLIARALREWRGPRERILIATKGGSERPDGRWTRNGRPRHLRAACERSLRALGVDELDLYQLHAVDPAVPLEESMGAFARLLEEGKILRVGLSNVSVEQIERARGVVPITSVQNRLNPFFRESIEEGVVAHCTEQGLGFLAYSPTGGGRLNRKLPDHGVVQAVAAAHGASPHAVVLAWVLAQGPTIIALSSARKPEHARDSAAASELQLSAEELRALDEAEFSTA
ncbi:MAG TPA: aldo/keto reductase [Gemmatimonadales bacterium]|nr:aldo/keto reductase [Gemmatimonadales bacterium]